MRYCSRVNHDLYFFQFIGQTVNGSTSQVHFIAVWDTVFYIVLYMLSNVGEPDVLCIKEINYAQ